MREFEAATSASVLEPSKSLTEGGQRLKSFLEKYVMETFLSQVCHKPVG